MSENIKSVKPQSAKERKAQKQAAMREELERSYQALAAIAAENEATKLSSDKTDEYLNKKQSKEEAKKRPKVKKELTITTKIILCILGIALVAVIIYLIYYVARYVTYGKYKEYIHTTEFEEGRAYSPIADSAKKVKGYELVAENDNIMLYTNTATADVAVYDKRNGEVSYSTPLNADNDTVANPTNKDMLKSQFILYYYNDDVVAGTINSYAGSVQPGWFKVESINDGVRYIYTITDGTAKFEVPLEYRIKDDYMEVNVPTTHIEELGGGYVFRIQLLRNFASTSYDDKGYMIVPNGSGSLINFNNGKKSAASYSQYIYDIDPLASTYTTVEPLETTRLPLFAICKEDSAVLATVEEGATNCVITATVSGAFNDYNYVYPTFVLRTVDDLKNFGNSNASVQVMEADMYKSNLTVRYTMLTEENSDYSGVATYYRERLISEGTLTPIVADGNIPFYMDVIGGVKETGHFLGVQYLHAFPMTTFDQAAEISNDLYANGINNQKMNFQGWFNGGYYHNSTGSDVRIMGKLGGKSDFEKLNETLAKNGGTLFGDVAFQKVSYADDSFPYQMVGSRYYGSGYVASFGMVNPTTLRNTYGMGYAENKYNVLSPKFLPRYVGTFTKKVNKIDVDGISLRDLGSYLASDKKRTSPVEREYALDIVKGQFDLLASTGKQIMTSEANDYAFAYTSDIINAPLSDTGYAIIDEQIPLYEMIIHGYINYSSRLLNYENDDDMDKVRLELIETGAYPHYVFTWEESSRMKLTALNRYYTTTYANWKDNALETYNVVNEALKDVQGQAIVKHEVIDENVRKTTYANGVSIIVNYGKEDATVDGITVKAMNYEVEGR